MAGLIIDDVYKSYGTVEVLHGVSIDIADGSFVVLVGPSGCGKSTLLRMVAGLETISAGQISIKDTIVNDLAPRERDVAMVFQNYALYPHMTVAQNMGFPLRLRKCSKNTIDDAVRGAADVLGLAPLLDRYPGQLSGGQRQRVAMGRSIVRDPQVFLFDEPLSNLDAKLRVTMRTEIKALYQRLGTTTVYVTHDQIEALTLADQVVIMNDGSVAQMGGPVEVYDRPDNLMVAGFIGSPAMNCIEGHLGEDRAYVRTKSGVSLPLAKPVGALPGTSVVYGVRPNDVRIADEGIALSVRVVEPTGPETMLSTHFNGDDFTVMTQDRVSIRPGETIFALPNLERVHTFDAITGLRIDG